MRNTVQVEEEDASQLKLTSEFQNEHCLLYSEVKILLEKLKENTEVGISSEKHNIGTVFEKTFQHVNRRYTNPETVKEVRKLLLGYASKLEPFEMAQIANLMPESAEEAKVLIPSLIFRIEDDDLQALLSEMQILYSSGTNY